MTVKNNGGPAFPAGRFVSDVNGNEIGGGMTLRDYIAIHVLSAAMASATGLSIEVVDEVVPEAALVCYRIADIMLEERNK